MAPKSSSVREELIRSAARLIGQEGSEKATLRRIAEAAGTSTMAVYTHFGGMAELRRAVRHDGFARFAAALAEVGPDGGPLVRLARLCATYMAFAADHPDLYRVMFMEEKLDELDLEACAGTFEALVSGIAACSDAGVLDDVDPLAAATEFWAVGHGLCTLQLSGLLTAEQVAATGAGSVAHLLVGLGAPRDAAERAVAAAASG